MQNTGIRDATSFWEIRRTGMRAKSAYTGMFHNPYGMLRKPSAFRHDRDDSRPEVVAYDAAYKADTVYHNIRSWSDSGRTRRSQDNSFTRNRVFLQPKPGRFCNISRKTGKASEKNQRIRWRKKCQNLPVAVQSGARIRRRGLHLSNE